ncbi:uncharacterized protein BDW43DRAFT_294985 [Aspergillus alliaceus]|uniref:uncharacterized protein n=1 Tax=Petromyces alliaceus TaxID=209559 RepID=UPI0012A4F077|nr:uncharacterized protein BDW43DRAFT_294985 [Aspergillus alliaceus]KAB8227088.1 hypothetical protein BDW43DRAFT_294985 [Aspergillus alliaceus]
MSLGTGFIMYHLLSLLDLLLYSALGQTLSISSLRSNCTLDDMLPFRCSNLKLIREKPYSANGTGKDCVFLSEVCGSF